jgi:hypothetical protein
MPEQHLVSGNYTIESNQYPGQLVTVGDCDAIVGYEKLVGGTQVVHLECISYTLTFVHIHVVGSQLRQRGLCDVPRRVG